MIVSCPSCQARFRVADEKVGPKGSRARCARCGSIILVPPPSASPVPEAPFDFRAVSAPLPAPHAEVGNAPPGFDRPAVTDLADLETTESRERRLAAVTASGYAPALPASAELEDAGPGAPGEVPPGAVPPVERTPGAPVPLPQPRPEGWAPVADRLRAPEEGAGEVAPEATGARGTAATAAATPDAPPATTGAHPADGEPLPAARWQSRVVNVASTAVVLAVAVGAFLWWRGDGLAGRLGRGAGAGGDVEVLDVSTGTYAADAGRRLVYVRGHVRSRVYGPVRVRAEMIRAGNVVAAGEVRAGVLPTPEDLAAIAGPPDLERLRAVLESRTPASADAGAPQPFLVPLLEPPGDPGGVSVRVDAVPAAR